MPRIRIVTDSACDIPEPLLRQYDVVVLPHVVKLGEDEYADRPGANDEQLLRRIRQGAGQAEVLAPSTDDFIALYRAMRETCDGVLSIHVSSRPVSDRGGRFHVHGHGAGLGGAGRGSGGAFRP